MAEKPNKKINKAKVKPKRKAPQDNSKFTVESYKNKIITFLTQYEKKSMLCRELEAKCRAMKGSPSNFRKAVSQLIEDGIIINRRQQKIALTSKLGYVPAEISRLSRTFGFAVTQDGTSVFIPGKFLLGAIVGDKVLVASIPSRSGSPEGEVVDILKESATPLTGRIERCEGELYFIADTMSKSHIRIDADDSIDFIEGDKVLAEISYRGKRHAEHRVRIIFSFGSSETAVACANSILMIHGAKLNFAPETLKEAAKISVAGVLECDFNNREDFRNMPIFTIDSAESKDLDDAVSVEKTKNGYRLGVHIADVSHYVKANSALDKEALSRGTSIYYANKVVPMLPKELSNGICSLNPNENRLTLSAVMELGSDGEMLSYKFCKSVICSRVKGVYSEINDILSGSATAEITDKYKEVIGVIPLMNELADILIKRKEQRNAPQLDTEESKLIINENDICVDVKPRTRGKSECIIEEFMLMANEAAARLAREKNVPFVYRIHETPPLEKSEKLRLILPKLGIECPPFSEMKPVHAAEILKQAKGTDISDVVTILMLRSMSKAKYSEEALGHFGLALKDYAHFTSPIRRYPDLAIHRIITDILAGYDQNWLTKRYGGFVANAAERSSGAEVRAVTIERDCEDCYKAEFMKSKIGESFDARISSVTEFGFYVALKNTVEGLVHIRTLPEGEYDFTEPFLLTEKFSGVSYSLGKKVRVICSSVNVNDGIIDFVLDDENAE